MTFSEKENPKLRLLDAQPVTYEGMSYLYLRDPLALTEKTLLVPEPFIPALSLCDGSRNLSTLRASLAMRFGLFLTIDRIVEFISALDDALLLDNENSRRELRKARDEFRSAAFRTPASAGLSYPGEPGELAKYLQDTIEALDGKAKPHPGRIRGIISPHIDFQRGGPVYAQVWSAAAETVREADLAIIFGTDHFSEGYPFTLTRQSYATPYGILPTNTAIVDELAQTIGLEAAFSGELHHRKEHSIELALVWLHHIRAGKPIETVPILCGMLEAALQSDRLNIEEVLTILHRAMKGRKAVVIAAGDLAHVGPAFGGDPVQPAKLIALKKSDDELIQTMIDGDAQGFYQSIERVQDANNVCGVAPIYLTLRLLSPLQGQHYGYSVCPADEHNTSVVTICGVTLQ